MSILINLFKVSYWSTQVVSDEAAQSALIKNLRQVVRMIYEIKIDFEGSWYPKGYFLKRRYLNRLHFVQCVVWTQVVTLSDDWTYHSVLWICDVSTLDLPSQGRAVPLCNQEQTMRRNQSSEN